MADLKAQLELSADVSGVEAGITKAKKSINSLGFAVQDANSRGAKSIDQFVRSLQLQAATAGKSAREVELWKLALRGATDAQLKAADAALRLAERQKESEVIGQRIRSGMLAIGAAAATALVAATAAFDSLIKKAGDFQDMAEKIGDSAQNVASLAVAAGTAGLSMETVVGAANKLTKGLTGVDDESKAAGAAISALGLNIEKFKALSPTDQIEQVAKALDGFQDGAEKSAVAMALFGKSGAEMLPFLKELSQEGGRQNILTAEQIRLADEYSDRQARLRTEISLHAQAIASDLLPALNEFTSTIAELAKDQEFAATASDALKGALSAAIVIFQTIAIVASDVGFVFKGVGREVGAIAAQLAALGRGDLTGFRAISNAVKEDAERARAELDRFQARVNSIGNTAPKFTDPRLLGSVGTIAEQAKAMGVTTKPKLKFDGAVKSGGGDAAGQIAKSQLASDIDDIKRASELMIGIYSDAEKIMEARRSAGLVDEREYYASKLAFIRLNSAEQERALQQEISRLQAEKVTGKDKIENARKIAEAEGRLQKLRQNTAASIEVNSINEAAAIKRVEQSYADAEQAAKSYLDTINRQAARELAGLGRGTQQRERDAQTNQRDDQFQTRRESLEGDLRRGQITREQYDRFLEIERDAYQRALQQDDAYWAAKLKKQQDWSVGASEAIANYYTEAANTAKLTEDLFTGTFQSMEDALVKFVTTGKLDFKSLADFIVEQIARIIIKQQLAASLGGNGGGDWLTSIVGSIFGGSTGGGFNMYGGSTGATNSLLMSIFGNGVAPRAIGGPVSAGGLYRVNEKGPELLQVAGKQYLMMGSQSGSVSPDVNGGGDNISITINQTFPVGTNRATTNQAASQAGMAIQRAVARNT